MKALHMGACADWCPCSCEACMGGGSGCLVAVYTGGEIAHGRKTGVTKHPRDCGEKKCRMCHPSEYDLGMTGFG